MVEIDSYSRDCNYFQNLENALDMSHIGFVHGDNVAIFKGIGLGRALDAEESAWGVTYGFTRPDGQKRVQQFGMPNIFYLTALPTDPEVGWQESMFWWVPIDDVSHMQFSVHRVPAQGDVAARIHARRQARRTEIDHPPPGSGARRPRRPRSRCATSTRRRSISCACRTTWRRSARA